MAVFWPTDVGFPQRPQVGGYEERLGSSTILGDTDLGPPLAQRVASKAVTTFNCTYQFDTLALADRMRTFWRNSAAGAPAGCNGGTEDIIWPSPRSLAATLTARMIQAPQFRALGGTVLQATVVMQVLE